VPAVPTYTVQDVIDKARRRIGIYGSSFVTDIQETLQECNDSLQELDEELARVVGESLYHKFQDLSTVAGTATYDITGLFGTGPPTEQVTPLRWVGVYLIRDEIAVPLSRLRRATVTTTSQRSWRSAEPRYTLGVVHPDFLFVTPPPDGVYDLSVEYIPRRSALGLSDPVGMYFEAGYEYVVLDLMRKWLKKEESDTVDVEADKQRYLARLIDLMTPKDQGDVVTVADGRALQSTDDGWWR
jgi:hypothetical protein